MTDPRPCAIYARRSVEDLANPGLSIPFQIDRGLQFCRARGLNAPPEHIYVDADISGKNLTERPDVLKLLSAMTAGAVQLVWIYNLDRLTRNLYDLPTLQQAADSGHCAVFAGDRQLDWQNPESEVGLIVEATFATYYRKRIAKNTREALHKMSKDGLWAGGRIPFWLKTAGRGHLVISEEHVPLLLRIFASYASGLSTGAIAHSLNRDGIPTPRGGLEWQHVTVYKILAHPTHYGRLQYGGDTNTTDIPSPVPEALLQAAQARLTTGAHRRGPNTISHSLFRLVRCALCGSACHRRRKVARGVEYYSLQCNAVGKGEYGIDPCPQPSVPWSQVDALELALVNIVRESRPVPRVWTPPPDTASRLALLEERKRIETAILRAGGCTVDQYEAVMRGVTNEIARYAAPDPPPDPARYQGVADMWDELNLGQRNALMRELLESVTIGPKRIDVTFKPLSWDEWPVGLTFHRGTGRVTLIY